MAPATVAAVRLCRYTPELTRSVLLSALQAKQVVAEANALRPTPAGQRRFTSCFFDPSAVTANLAYADGHAVEIYVETSSCFYATHGDIARSYPQKAIEKLVALLVHLAG
jgi:prepilin-type processing-associated H-X9-DG protein